MFSVPSVTMNAGRRSAVTSPPFSMPKRDAREDAERERGERRHAVLDRELRHHDLAERHHRPDGEVDAGGEDHERLADRQHADDHHLLEHEREVLPEEPVALEREEHHRAQQREQRGDGRRGEHPRAELERAARPSSLLVRLSCRSSILAGTAVTGARRATPRSRSIRDLPPAVGEAVGDVLRGNACHRLLGDQVEAGVGVAGGLRAGLRELDDRRDAE